jgi:mannitol/fructose-specific phosphotransferase system IIA component (Ntr-type)
MLSRGSQLKYFIKKQGKDKRVVRYYPTKKSLELMKAHVEVLVNLKNILGDKDIIKKIGISSKKELFAILDSVIED